MTLEIESSDVIKIVLQFLQEHNLTRTLRTLQDETNVSLNMVPNLSELLSNIEHGRWSPVLSTISNLRLSRDLQFDLFEQICIELTEQLEFECARQLLLKSQPLVSMHKHDASRWSRLQQLIHSRMQSHNSSKASNTSNASNSAEDAAFASLCRNKASRRKQLREEVRAEVFEIPPSRLLSLISQAVKYQQLTGRLQKGHNFDLLQGLDRSQQGSGASGGSKSGATNNAGGGGRGGTGAGGGGEDRDRDERIVRKNTCLMRFAGKDREDGSNEKTSCYASACAFTPDGELLVTGSNDGFLEVWDYDTGKLRTDLECQKSKNDLMMHAQGVQVTCIAFSRDSELMATAGQDGCIKIWRLHDGTCPCKFVNAHTGAISSLEFNFDGTQILSSSLDTSVKIHGLRSKRVLKEFIGHTSFVNTAIYSYDNSCIVSGSSDGTLRVWDAKSTNCQKLLKNLSLLAVQPSTAMSEYLATMYGSKTSNSDEMESKSGDNAGMNQIGANSDLKSESTVGDAVAIRKVMVHAGSKSQSEVLVINESLIVYVVNIKDGHVVQTIQSNKLVTNHLARQKAQMERMTLGGAGGKRGVNEEVYKNAFFDGCLSCRGGYLYVLAMDCVVYVFSIVTAKLVHVVKVHEKDVLGVTHHPHRNVMATYSKDQTLKVWRP